MALPAFAEKMINIIGPFNKVTLVETDDQELYFIQQNGTTTKTFPKRRLSYYGSFFATDATYHSIATASAAAVSLTSSLVTKKIHNLLVRDSVYSSHPLLSCVLVGASALLPVAFLASTYIHGESYTKPAFKASFLNKELLSTLGYLKSGDSTVVATSLNFKITHEGRFVVSYGLFNPENTKVSKKLI